MNNIVAWIVSFAVSAYPGYRYMKWATDNFRFGVAADNFAYMNILSSGFAFFILVFVVHFLLMGISF
jgi:hypothetical protein